MNDGTVSRDNVRVSDVLGASIYNLGGEPIGRVGDIVIERTDGKIKYAILSFGSYFGSGHDYFPMPWTELKYNQYLDGFVIDVTRQLLENAPRYTAGNDPDWNSQAYEETIQNYYGATPI